MRKLLRTLLLASIASAVVIIMTYAVVSMTRRKANTRTSVYVGVVGEWRVAIIETETYGKVKREADFIPAFGRVTKSIILEDINGDGIWDTLLVEKGNPVTSNCWAKINPPQEVNRGFCDEPEG